MIRGRWRGALWACLVVLLTGPASASCRSRRSFPSAPILLISIDTLRADHLRAYGYTGVDTPALDRLTRDSILFENAYSHVPLTLPSHATLMTGRLPPENGVRDNTGYHLDPGLPTLAETLKPSGYATGAAVSSVVLARTSGIDRGFDSYDDAIEVAEPGVSLGSIQRSGFQTEALAEKWISEHSAQPFFFFLHLYEPHAPYEPPEPFATRYRASPYDGEIAAADAIVDRFLSFLKARGLYDRSLVVLLSDHGEGLGDHGEDEHGLLLYRESLRVPLLLKLPDGRSAGTRSGSAVGLVDVFPTIAGLVGMAPPSRLAGASLLDPASGSDRDRAIYSETLFPRYHFGWSDLAALTTDRFQYIHGPSPELYDLGEDSTERRNLAAQKPPAFRKLRAELLAMPRPRRPPGASDPETLAKLAALGYIGAASPSEDSRNLPDPKDRVEDLRALKLALGLYRDRRLVQAREAFRDLVRKDPAMSDAWGGLAEVEHKLGENEGALAALREQDRLIPGSPHVLLSFANEYLEMGRLPEARQAVARALAAGDLPEAHELLARIDVAARDFAGAEREARRALEGHPGRYLPRFVLAQVARERRDYWGALRLLDEVLERQKTSGLPEMSNVHFLRGDVLARLGRTLEARAELEREIQLFPNNPSAWTGLAFLHASSGRPEEARATLERLVRTSPTPRAYLAAAESFRILGDPRSAAVLTARARSAHPSR